MIRIFIGYDNRIPTAYQVLTHSITTRSSLPVTFCPINLTNLSSVYKREGDALASTEFSFSRFLTPYLSGYEGWSIFMDNDILCLDDIAKLWEQRDDRYAVMCVKHDHNPKEDKKFTDAAQTKYEKKNWSSVMMFNNAKCKMLTPHYVNNASGLQLHQFKWLEGDDLIGSIPEQWNHLVGYSSHDSSTPLSMLHFTQGGPFYYAYKDTPFADRWFEEFMLANSGEMSFEDMAKEALKYTQKAITRKTA
jgi:hypothetical protein